MQYFLLRSYPRNDLESLQCLLKIKPAKDICWIRFDFLDIKLGTGNPSGCSYDSIGIIDRYGS